AIGGVLYVVPILAMLFFASIVRGLGWAGVNTGGYTLLAGGAPAARRGEASGYYTGVTSSAGVVFPALSLWLIDQSFGGFSMVFMLSAVFAPAGLPPAFSLGRTAAPD